MKIMTFNVRIWTRDTDSSSNRFWKTRMQKMKDLILRENPDIICFQEMMFPATNYIPSGYKRVGISAHHSMFINKKSGITAKNHCFSIFYEYADIKGQGMEFRLVNVHPRWEEDLSTKTLSKVQDLVKARKCVVCGDFNVFIEDVRRNGLTRGYSVREYLGIEKKDTFENYNRPTESHGEIDHFIVGGMQMPKTYTLIEDYSMSDHRPLFIEF